MSVIVRINSLIFLNKFEFFLEFYYDFKNTVFEKKYEACSKFVKFRSILKILIDFLIKIIDKSSKQIMNSFDTKKIILDWLNS